MWAEWGKGTLRMDFTGPIFWARVRTPAARRDEAALTGALARFDRDLAVLEAQIGAGPCVLGETFTVADILVGHQLYRYFTIDVPAPTARHRRLLRPALRPSGLRRARHGILRQPAGSRRLMRRPPIAPAATQFPSELRMITVYGRATSSNVQAVMWAIGRARPAARAARLRPRRSAGTDTPEFRAMNPNGLVPVLRDDELTMFESGAILRYLAGRYGGSPFWPADPVARAPIDMWAEWGKTTSAARLPASGVLALVRTPPSRARPGGARAARCGGRRAGSTSSRRSIGDEPCIAGDGLHARRRRGRSSAFTATSPLDIPRRERPALAAYYDRLTRASGLRRDTSWSPTSRCARGEA